MQKSRVGTVKAVNGVLAVALLAALLVNELAAKVREDLFTLFTEKALKLGFPRRLRADEVHRAVLPYGQRGIARKAALFHDRRAHPRKRRIGNATSEQLGTGNCHGLKNGVARAIAAV